MELRSAEQELGELELDYQRLCQSEKALPPLATTPPSETKQQHIDKERDAAQVLSTLDSIRNRLGSMSPKMERFRKRMAEKDPVTEAPRYGEKTMTRVKTLLQTYDALTEAIRLAFGEDSEEQSSNNNGAVVTDLRLLVAQQEEEARKKALEQEELLKKKQEQEKAAEKRRLEQERQQQEEARLAEARQAQELALRAQQSRLAREEVERRAQEQERRIREEAERRDREWMATITKGPDGVREQLAVLREGTDAADFQTALNALHTLFSQIVSHPEEVNFRRVRRDHPQFDKDIGRHPGGRELLIAAGFRLGAIDDVPCFISTEPDIEKEMDAWSEWFDSLKATLEILEQELIK